MNSHKNHLLRTGLATILLLALSTISRSQEISLFGGISFTSQVRFENQEFDLRTFRNFYRCSLTYTIFRKL